MPPNSAKESYDRHWSPELACLAAIVILRQTKDRLTFPLL
jgi:hypothetical protein